MKDLIAAQLMKTMETASHHLLTRGEDRTSMKYQSDAFTRYTSMNARNNKCNWYSKIQEVVYVTLFFRKLAIFVQDFENVSS